MLHVSCIRDAIPNCIKEASEIPLFFFSNPRNLQIANNLTIHNMTSNLEIIIVHRPDGPGAMHEKSPEFLDSMKYVNSQKGCRSTQWGRALNDPSVTICIYGAGGLIS